ncbi:MAG TPA: hypothetical protein VF941_17090 [Clostridia bacterium]
MYKKGIFLILISLIISILSVSCSNIKTPDASNASTTVNKYIETNDNLVFGNKLFVPQNVNIIPKNIGKQCGITDNKKQVFEIDGQKPNEWVCMLDNGVTKVYKEQSVEFISFKDFKPVKFKVKDMKSNKVTKEIIDINVINKVVSEMCKENVVNPPNSPSMMSQLDFESYKCPGLVFSYIFLHDESTKLCFIVDQSNNITWKIGHELMDLIM